MKTENVQRQNIIELKKERCMETKKIQNEQVGEKPKKEIQTARKSTNPTKMARPTELKSSDLSGKEEEEEQNTSIDIEASDDCQLSMSTSSAIEKNNEEPDTVSVPIKELVETPDDDKPVKENEDKDIAKVWENIRKDLTVSEEQEDMETNKNEDDDEFMSIPTEKPEVIEEEEPSDWEEHEEQSENEIENEKQINETEVASSECVLILSDEDVETEEVQLNLKESEKEKPVDTNSDDLTNVIKEEENKTKLSEEIPSKIDDNENVQETDNSPNEEITENKITELQSTENLKSEVTEESENQEVTESKLDIENESKEETKETLLSSESISDKTDKTNNEDSNHSVMDSTKITIKRKLSSGNEEYELKKIKLDDSQSNEENNLHANENGDSDSNMEIPSNETDTKSTILSQKALEDMIAQEICEYMMEGSKNCIMTWKKKYQELESVIEVWKKKAERLQQQLAELQIEQKKLLSMGNRPPVPFKKTTRTVGINVRLPQELLTRTVGTNVNLPQDKSSVPPVPMQLIANSALGPTKTITTTTASTTIKSVGSAISIIDLTREDGESAGGVASGSSLTTLSGGNVIVSSAAASRTITLTTATNRNSGVVAVPLVCTTLPSMMPFLSTTPTAATTNIQASQSSATSVPTNNLNQAARVTYLLPQVTTPLPVNSTRPVVSNQAINASPKSTATMPTIFLRMSSPPASTNRFPVPQAVATSVPSAISVLPVPRSSVTSTISQRPLQTVVVSNMSVNNTGTLISGNSITSASDVNQFISTTKSNMMPKPTGLVTSGGSSTVMISCVAKHPAPLPSHSPNPENPHYKSVPPKPALKISRVSNGIVLSWNMILHTSHAEISSYQLYAYQEGNGPPSTSLWKKVGDVKALPLPMACTLTQFVEGHTYHFAVRAVDTHSRVGLFSEPTSIALVGGERRK